MTEAITEALSVGELAARAGVTVRTVRYYQSEDLLAAPARQGREARYDASHLDRLRVISELRERGLRLSAIRDLLHHSGDDAPATDWLGLGDALARPWSEDHPRLLSEPDLADRLAGLPTATLEALVRTGAVERRSDTTPVVYLVPSPGLFEIALALVRLGFDLETGARLRDLVQRRLRTMATDLVARFTEEVSLARLADQGPGGLARLLDDLQPLTRRTVDLLFAHEMERAQRELLAAAIEPASAG